MLKFAVLGSGSSGNSAVLCCGQTKLLIDAGLSAKQICLRLESLGIDPDEISGILLTHEHGDHARGIDVFCRKRNLPIYGTTHTCEMVREQVKSSVRWHHFEAGSEFVIGEKKSEVKIQSFSVPHDAVDPVGFVLRDRDSSLGILSDVGHVTHMIVDHLVGVDTLFAEANYDEMMLQNDTLRPWSTKQRISNRHGHLSNEQTAELIKKVARNNLKQVVLGHLSSDCNCPELAQRVIQDALCELNLAEVPVLCAERANAIPMRDVANKKTRKSIHSTSQKRSSEKTELFNESEGQWVQTEWAF